MVESIIKMLKGGSIDSDLQEAIARKVGEVEFFSGSRDRGVGDAKILAGSNGPGFDLGGKVVEREESAVVVGYGK